MTTTRSHTLAVRAEAVAYAALRIVSGAMFTFHGVQKVFGWYAPGPMPPFGSQIWIGGLLELIIGPLVALGLFTRLAALLGSGMMAVAYIQYHWKLAFAGAMWIPTLNQGELAVLYCFVFLFIAVRGGGAASLDKRRRVP